ncbi:hypothetical protein FQN57_004635 [Myotisia sp. PD_48]|nr:hypothetical protein FQN57_004635 [Myotisia sp. PD_48]
MMFSGRLTTLVVLLAASLTQAAPQPSSTPAEVNGEGDVGALAIFSCAGSSKCSLGLAGECIGARNLIDSRHLYHTRAGSRETGVCYGKCGIFVQGKNCDLSGAEMRTGFNELRSRGCQVCGSKTYDDGCRLVINYVTGC